MKKERFTKKLLRSLLRLFFKVFFRLRVQGLENMPKNERVVVICNHQSFLDALVVAAHLDFDTVFPVDTFIAKKPLIRLFLRSGIVRTFEMNSENPYAMRNLIRYLEKHPHTSLMVFPEGRITVTSGLMKVYDGAAMVASRIEAPLLPMRIEGAQYSKFSRLKGVIPLKNFPQIKLFITPRVTLEVNDELKGRARRKALGRKLEVLMRDVIFKTTPIDKTLPQAFDEAADTYGWKLEIMQDMNRQPLTYRRFKTGAHVLSKPIGKKAGKSQYVGVLLPTVQAGAVTFWAILNLSKTAAMLNFTAGRKALEDAITMTGLEVIVTSRAFVEKAKLEALVEALSDKADILYLEDVRESIGLPQKLAGLFKAHCRWKTKAKPNDPAVVLFTSGSEGRPKGVVLSHKNLVANVEQIVGSISVSPHDRMLNALPLFHSFGLTGGMVLPLLKGIPTMLYPSPLHYRIVPEMAYNFNATIMFGTDTFMSRYARFAHPYDFYKLRIAFVGAEKLKEETRNVWVNRFGVRLLEGYGATETAPMLAVNTLHEPRPGTVGRVAPGMQAVLRDVPGVLDGGRLIVKGPNVMLGYLKVDHPQEIRFPEEVEGEGWYDTGDVVHIDDEGFVTIKGRAKRFAKVAGEMVSLGAIEAFLEKLQPGHQHAVAAIPDKVKGERLVWVTTNVEAKRKDLIQPAQKAGLSSLSVPHEVVVVDKFPLLGAGKTDFPAIQRLVEEKLGIHKKDK